MELENIQKGQSGRMMAVGLSPEKIQLQLSALKSGKVTIACFNSPVSVTVSGDSTAIEELHVVLEKQGVFNRMLRVKFAYHSHHMELMAHRYAQSLSLITTNARNPSINFCSTVFPGIPLETSAEYWVQNLLSPVRFNDAVQKLCSSRSTLPDILVEVGPHSALAGPLKQILSDAAPSPRPAYFPTLERVKSEVDTMLDLASGLFTQGVQIKAGEVNFPAEINARRQVLTDLPTYPWNHAIRYWHEGRISRNYLFRNFPSHDLLGTMTDDCSELDMRWTNVLRLSDVPWLSNHALHSEAILPGASYLVMAIEAARQRALITESSIKSYVLRDVRFSVALMVPDTASGIEISFLLEPLRESSMTVSTSWSSFRVLSYSSDRKATEHCRGLISTTQDVSAVSFDESLQSFSDEADQYQEADREYFQMLRKFKEAGVELGDTFQLLSKTSFPTHVAHTSVCDLKIPDTKSLMPCRFESPDVVRTQVLDAAFQVSVVAIVTLCATFSGPLFPTFVEEIFVSKDITNEAGHVFRARGLANTLGQGFSGSAIIYDKTNAKREPVLSFSGARSMFAPAMKKATSGVNQDEYLCWNTVWRPDVKFFNQSHAERLWDKHEMGSLELAKNALLEQASFFCIRRALEQLSNADEENMLQYHQNFVSWAQSRLRLGLTGSLDYQTPEWHTNDKSIIESTIQNASEAGPLGKMTIQVGRQLLGVLRREIDPLAIMLENNLLDEYYADLKNQDRAYEYVARYVSLVAHKNPGLKILEVGAGTGSATSFVLNALGSHESGKTPCSLYHFTDISAGFFENAR